MLWPRDLERSSGTKTEVPFPLPALIVLESAMEADEKGEVFNSLS